jgi:hypothetical protein
MSTELTLVQRAVAAFDYKEEELRELAARSVTIKEITNVAGYQQVHAARMVLKNRRIEIEKHGKEKRDEAVKFSKAVIAQEGKLVALIEPEETRLEKLQKSWDDAREAEKQAAIAAEQKRVDDLMDRVNELRGVIAAAAGCTSSEIQGHISDIERIAVDESFQEFQQEAAEVKEGSLLRLRQMHAAAAAQEAEKERLRLERIELEALRAEQKKRDDAERARIAEEERVAKAARDAETARQNEELRMAREAQEAEAARVRAEQAAEAKRLADAQAELTRMQEEIRKAQEPPPAPPPLPPAPVSRRGVAVPVPKAAEMIDVLAKHYRARPDTIIEWLRAIDWKQAEAA